MQAVGMSVLCLSYPDRIEVDTHTHTHTGTHHACARATPRPHVPLPVTHHTLTRNRSQTSNSIHTYNTLTTPPYQTQHIHTNMPFNLEDMIKEGVATMFFCWVCMAEGNFTAALGLAACMNAFGASMNPAANFQQFARGKFADLEGFALSTLYQLVGAGCANYLAPKVGLSATALPAGFNDFSQGAFVKEVVGTMFFLAAFNAADGATNKGFALMAATLVFECTANPAVTFSRIGFSEIGKNAEGFLFMFSAQCFGAFLANMSDEKLKKD